MGFIIGGGWGDFLRDDDHLHHHEKAFSFLHFSNLRDNDECKAGVGDFCLK